MWKLLKIIKKNLIMSIVLFMLIGLVCGYYLDTTILKSLILPITMLMIYPMMVNLNVRQLVKIDNIKLHLTTQFINFTIIPVVGFFIGKVFFSEQISFLIGFLLIALLPTSGMTISWTGFAKGSVKDAIKMTVIGLILGAVLAPIYIKIFMGETVSISLINIFKQIFLVIFIPMILGYLTRITIIKTTSEENYKTKWKNRFPLLSTLGLALIIFVSTSLKSKNIIANPNLILQMILPITIFYLINFVISTLIGKIFFTKEKAIALVYGTALRNLSISMGLAVALFGLQGSSIALIISISYIFQVQFAAWYIKVAESSFFKKFTRYKNAYADKY